MMIFYSIISLIFQIQYISTINGPEEYLRKYGYIDADSRSSVDMNEAIKIFQINFKLPVTGIADNKTIELMSKPRCGVPDPVFRIRTRKQQDNYILQGSKWTNYKLTYKIIRWSRKLDQNKTIEAIEKAFKIWSAVTPLRFIQEEDLESKVHFDILFATRRHCCHESSIEDSKFDGPGGTLAHTAYPMGGGDIHIDDDEDWAIYVDGNKPSLLYSLTHEIGHGLGLMHVYDLDSIMFPHDFTGLKRTKLDSGSIKAVRILYGNQTIQLP